MKPHPFLCLAPLLAVPALIAPASATVNPPSPVSGSLESWTQFTKQAVTTGDFAGWRDALGDRLRSELPPTQVARVDQPATALALAQYQFLKDVLAPDAQALATVASGSNGAEFLTWLLSNREVLEDYNGVAGVFQLSKKRTFGLEGWRDIYRDFSESREPGLWRRVGVACAIAFAEPRGKVTPLERFSFYRDSQTAGQLIPYFSKALPFELALTVHADGRGNDELEWAQDVTPKDKKTQTGVGGYGHSLIAYRLDNYRGQTVQGPEYYDRKGNDLSTAMEYGGVCGMISHMNSTVANAHGEPAFTVGQPGHCAYVWKSDDHTWAGGNFVSGWMDTHDSHQQPFWMSKYSANINMVSAAVESPGFAKAERLRSLANAWREKDAAKAQDVLAAATAADPAHYLAWKDRLDVALAIKGASATLWRTMAAQLAKDFPKFPTAMTDLLGKFENERLLTGLSDAERVAYATATAKALTSVPHAEQWDLIYPAWKPWLARQLSGFGLLEKDAAKVVDANLILSKKDGDKKVDADTVWSHVPKEKRAGVESLFAALLPALEENSTLYKGTAAAWLALVAEDTDANARAAAYFQKKLATADDLKDLEMIGGSLLEATRRSADARADLATMMRQRLAVAKKPDPTRVDALLGLIAQYDFRESSRIGTWAPAQFTSGGEQTLEWDLTPFVARAAGDYALHLNFRWTAGAPLALKSVRLLENDTELNADTGAETADAALRPAVVTLRLPNPKPGAKYTLKAVATGGQDSAGVILSRAEAVATFNKEEWSSIGGWGGKEIKAAQEITDGWHQLEFDATKYVGAAGPVFVLFKYSSYSSPRVMGVRLFADGAELSADLHSCNPISGSNTMYALRLPPNLKSGAKITVRALFTPADGWGQVYVKKQPEKKTAAR